MELQSLYLQPRGFSFLIAVIVRTPLLGCACAPTVYPSATFENSDPAGSCAVPCSAPWPGRTAAVAPRAWTCRGDGAASRDLPAKSLETV